MKFLVIGDAMVDEYLYGEINRMSPEDSSVPVVDLDGEPSERRKGGCLNVAENLKSLGAEACVSTIMPIGDFLEDWDDNYSVPGYPLIKQRVVNKKTGKQIVRLDTNKRYSEKDVSSYKEHVEERPFLQEFDAIIVSDYNKGVIDEYWINRLANTNKWVFVDTKKPDLSVWDKIPNCIIKINRKEYRDSNRTTKHRLIVTGGEYGATLKESEQHSVLYPAPEKVENPDVIGAGDVFLAALAVRYLERLDLGAAITYANHAAYLSVKKQGTCTVAKAEIEQDVHWEDVYDKWL